MPIKRCTEQSSGTLEEFYLRFSQNDESYFVDVGKSMLRFIDVVDRLFKKTLIWGLTSHANLLLQNTDDSASPCYVVIRCSEFSAPDLNEYYFEYLIPADKRPWENAYVTGKAASWAHVENYLLIAMRESKGWVGNEELDKLLTERNLSS